MGLNFSCFTHVPIDWSQFLVFYVCSYRWVSIPCVFEMSKLACILNEAFRSHCGSSATVAVMPPKLSDAAIDGKLVALRDYVLAHLEELDARDSSCLKAVFAGRRNDEEARFYLFLYKNEARFTEAQRRHGRVTREIVAMHSDAAIAAMQRALVVAAASTNGHGAGGKRLRESV